MHVTYCRQKQGFFSPAELYMQKFRMAGRLVGVILIVITMREASNMDPYTFFFSFFCKTYNKKNYHNDQKDFISRAEIPFPYVF